MIYLMRTRICSCSRIGCGTAGTRDSALRNIQYSHAPFCPSKKAGAKSKIPSLVHEGESWNRRMPPAVATARYANTEGNFLKQSGAFFWNARNRNHHHAILQAATTKAYIQSRNDVSAPAIASRPPKSHPPKTNAKNAGTAIPIPPQN